MAEVTADELTRTYDGTEVPVAGTYEIDPSHSSVGFVARHLVVSKVRGHFERFSGRILVGEAIEQSSVEVTVDVASIATNEDQRDAHLRSADFFDADRYPELGFVSRAVRHVRGERFEIEGDLTIRDVTRSVVLEAEFNGATRDPWGGVRVGFSAGTEIERDAFGLTWNVALEAGGFVVGPKVKIELEVEATRV